MKEIEFTGYRIVLREEVEVFGETETEERSVEYSNRDEFILNIDTGGHVSLESLVNVEYNEDDSISSLTLQFDQIPSARATARREQSQSPRSKKEAPPVPNVDLDDIEVQARRNFYERLRKSSDSQPAEIRQLIYEHQELSREEFDRLIEDELGYTADGGGANMCLIVLESVTDEIERHGRGDDQTIEWTG